MFSNGIPATSGIYKITCIPTGKFYIGSAIDLRRRRYEHRSELQRNDHPNPKLQNAWNKYSPEAFLFEVIELVLPISLTAREQYWLDKLKPFGHKGFNLVRVAGSSLGMKHTPASLAKMGATHRGKSLSLEHRAKLSTAGLGNTNRRGKKASLETRQRMGIAHLGNRSFRGKKLSPEHRAKISATQPMASLGRMKTLIVTDPSGIEYTIHGISGFCREHHLTRSHLTQVANGKRTHHKGWKARYPDTDVG